MTPALFFWPGCASSPGASPAGQTRFDGMTLTVSVQRGPNSEALYKITPDGMLHYAGGRNARERDFTWSGTTDEALLDQLRAAMTKHGWTSGEPGSADDPPVDDITRIAVNLRGADGRKKFTIRGSNDGARQIIALLEQAARARHERFLDSLPKPSREKPGSP